ncbi:MAG: hypothetical protein E7496_00175 [Ruminococcus sp.]|nr:hypothetical protein [Ruminococcus sp.]
MKLKAFRGQDDEQFMRFGRNGDSIKRGVGFKERVILLIFQEIE